MKSIKDKFKPVYLQILILSVLVVFLVLTYVFIGDQAKRHINVVPQRHPVVNMLYEDSSQRVEKPVGSWLSAPVLPVPKPLKPCPGGRTAAIATTTRLGIGIKVPILMYHYIEPTPATTALPNLYHNPKIFESQLESLQNSCYQTIFVSELGETLATGATLPTNPIALTFDDGYEDMYTQAFPLLKKYGMKGTMYIIVNALGTPGYLTAAQAKEMADSGFVEIAAHTLSHPDLRKANPKRDYLEIAGSKWALEKAIGRTVKDFAYPYGFFGAREMEICRQAGYLTCASTYPGQVQNYPNRFTLVRLRPGYRTGQVFINWLQAPGPKRG